MLNPKAYMIIVLVFSKFQRSEPTAGRVGLITTVFEPTNLIALASGRWWATAC